MSRVPKSTIGKREARRVLWSRLADTVVADMDIAADWLETERTVPRDANGNVTDDTLLVFEEAAEDVRDYIRRRFVEQAPKRHRG